MTLNAAATLAILRLMVKLATWSTNPIRMEKLTG